MKKNEIKTSSDYDKNIPKMNDLAYSLDGRVRGPFFDAVFEMCEDQWETREEANDFIKFLKKEHPTIVRPISLIDVIENIIEMQDDDGNYDEEE